MCPQTSSTGISPGTQYKSELSGLYPRPTDSEIPGARPNDLLFDSLQVMHAQGFENPSFWELEKQCLSQDC